MFAGNTEGIRSYRITGIVVTTKGTVLAYCEARKNNSSDRGEIEVHLHRSIDGGKTWKGPEKFATGDGWAENIKTNKLALRNNQTNLFLNLCFKE